MKKLTSNFENSQKALYYGTDFINGMRRTIVMALALIYFLSLGFNLVSITTLFAVSGIFLVAFESITGPVADHVSRKLSTVISFSLMGIAFLGIFSFKDFWVLAFFWVLNDIAWTFQSGATTAWIIDTLNYGKHRANLAGLFSRVYFFEKSGRVVGSLIGFFVVAISFRAIWLAIAISNFIMAFVLWKYMEERNFRSDKSKKHLIFKTWLKTKEALIFMFGNKNKQFRGLIASMILATIGGVALYVAAPLVLKETYNLSPSNISGLFILIGIVLLVGPFIGERAVHKWGIRKSMFFGFLLIAIGKLAFTFTSSLIFAAVCLGFLEAIGIGTDVVFDTAVHHKIKSSVRASMGSAMSMIWTIASSITMGLTGLSIATFGLITTLLISTCFSVITAFCYLIFVRD